MFKRTKVLKQLLEHWESLHSYFSWNLNQVTGQLSNFPLYTFVSSFPYHVMRIKHLTSQQLWKILPLFYCHIFDRMLNRKKFLFIGYQCKISLSYLCFSRFFLQITSFERSTQKMSLKVIPLSQLKKYLMR